VHANLFLKAIDALKKKKELEKVDYHVCSVCGNTFEGTPPEKCPICGTPKTKFFKPA
jgi:rubrerythrin